ncbi:MAG: hypothetical protein ACI8VC_000068 [Candidatus Endobugula sp.]
MIKSSTPQERLLFMPPRLYRPTRLLLSSFFTATGKYLLASASTEALSQALYHAPFCVLSHNTEVDPIFNYANKTAQALFEMSWDELTSLPSRLSAEPIEQQERNTLLSRVREHGFIDDFTGIRVSATGKKFLITDAIVWDIRDEHDIYHGQAVVLYSWTCQP